MGGMIDRSGRVVAVYARHVTVRFEREAACGACRAAKVCAGSAPGAQLTLSVPAGRRLAEGDVVRVGVSEAAALRATAMTYLTPLGALATAMLLAAAAGLPEGAVAAASFGGLAAGFALVRRLARRPAYRLQPELADGPGCPS